MHRTEYPPTTHGGIATLADVEYWYTADHTQQSISALIERDALGTITAIVWYGTTPDHLAIITGEEASDLLHMLDYCDDEEHIIDALLTHAHAAWQEIEELQAVA